MTDPLVGTANFTPAEWERQSTDGHTPDAYRFAAQNTLEVLQRFRDALGVPVIITDAWRSPDDNAHTAGSARNSQHMSGDGVDFDVPSLSKRQVAQLLDDAEANGELGDYRQLIYYLTDGHYHVGTGTGRQKLVKVDTTNYETYTGPDSLPDTRPGPLGAATASTLFVLAAIGVALVLLRKRVSL